MSKGYRAPPIDTDLRPLYRSRPKAESSSAAAYAPNRALSAGEQSSRPSAGAQWPSRSSSASDWSNRPSSASNWSSDGALSVLNSCGLDPSDLSLLAELPEDMLTVKSLPHVLSQMKGNKKDVRPNTSGYQPTGPAHRQLPGQSKPQFQGSAQRRFSGQSQPSYSGTTNLPTTNYKPSASSSSSSSSSASFVVDYGHRTMTPALSKIPERPVRKAQPSQGFGALDQKGYRRSAEPKLGTVKLPPPSTTDAVPTEKQARDFHGMKPSEFPYSCSLCDIVVLFENAWSQHINGTQHADGQLSLLQRFAGWDCRLASVSKSESQRPKEKESEKKPAKNISKKEKDPNQKTQKAKGKVVCVKFPPRSVEEPYLRKLTEPFGEIRNVAMFPSLGFIELGSAEQAQELVESFTKSPPTVNGQQIEFSISNTFNFLQSSFVVFFSPVPFGKEGQADLITIIKRFGMPLYSMFLPQNMQAYVEMQNAADAHKLVEYYSGTPLRMNGVDISVSFSQEYRTLERCALAKPYEDESVKKPAPKRQPKNSQDHNKKTQDQQQVSHNEEKKRSESRERTQEKSPQKSDKCDSKRNDSRERGVKDAKDGGGKKENQKSVDKASSGRQNKDKTVKSQPKEAGSKTETKKSAQKSGSDEQNKAPKRGSQEKTSSSEKKDAESKAETGQKEQVEDTHYLSDEGSDIEGMQVMGEHLDEEEERNEDEDTWFPFDLDNCITLDEVNDSDDQDEEVKEDRKSSRVVFIGNLPQCDYADTDFLKMVKSFGKPVRYFLNQIDRMGLVEMPSSAEATDLCRNLRNHSFKGSVLRPSISEKYNRLHSGWDVRYDSSDSKHRHNRSGSKNRKSKSPDERETRKEPSKSESEEKEISEQSSKLDKNGTRTTEKESQEEKLPSTNESDASKEDDEEGWVVYDDMEEENSTLKTAETFEDIICESIRIENVVSLKNHTDDINKEQEEGFLVEMEESTNNERVEEEAAILESEKKDEERTESDIPNKMPTTEESTLETDQKVVSEESADEIVGESKLGEGLTNKMADREDLGIEEGLVQNPVDKLSVQEEGWLVSNLSTEEETAAQNGGCSGSDVMEGGNSSAILSEEKGTEELRGKKGRGKRGRGKAVRRKGSEDTEAESGPEKKSKDDTPQDLTDESAPTEGGATETRTPNKPIGTEYIRYYCHLCHVIYADEEEAKVTHCSSLQHYEKYQEITGKDPWTS